MDASGESNPYAASSLIPEGLPTVAISRWEIGAKLILAHTLSGACSMMVIVGVTMIASTQPRNIRSGGAWASAMTAIGGSGILSIMIFGTVSTLSVPLLLLGLGNLRVFGGIQWGKSNFVNFTRASGFLVGCLPLLLMSIFNPILIFFSFVPGILIALLSPLFVRGLVRKVANLSSAG